MRAKRESRITLVVGRPVTGDSEDTIRCITVYDYSSDRSPFDLSSASNSPLYHSPAPCSSPRLAPCASTSTMPIAIPATQPGPDLSALPHTNSKAPFLEDLRTKGYAVIPSIIPQDRVGRYIDDAHSWLEEFGMGYKRDDKTTWRWVAASLFEGHCSFLLATNVSSGMPLPVIEYGGDELGNELHLSRTNSVCAIASAPPPVHRPDGTRHALRQSPDPHGSHRPELSAEHSAADDHHCDRRLLSLSLRFSFPLPFTTLSPVFLVPVSHPERALTLLS
jgi:hypothetical protein